MLLSRIGLLSVVLLVLAGCSGPTPDSAVPVAKAVEADARLLEPLLLKEKPTAVQSFAEVRDKAADGDEVIVQGQVPPETTKPFLENRAAFLLMGLADLGDPKIKEELECEDAAT